MSNFVCKPTTTLTDHAGRREEIILPRQPDQSPMRHRDGSPELRLDPPKPRYNVVGVSAQACPEGEDALDVHCTFASQPERLRRYRPDDY